MTVVHGSDSEATTVLGAGVRPAAVAVPAPPARMTAVVGALTFAAAGGFGAWLMGEQMDVQPFRVGGDMSAFAGLIAFAAAVERVLEPLTRWMPGRREDRALVAWGIATALATVLAAGSGFYLMRMIAESSAWGGVPAWVDALVTGLVVGTGTKPLHDLFTRIQPG